MRMIAAAVLAAATAFAHAAPVSQDDAAFSRLWNQIRAGKVKVDHIASIGKFDYEVFVDRNVSPIVVIMKRSDEPLADLSATMNVGDLAAPFGSQAKLLAEYQQMFIMGHGRSAKKPGAEEEKSGGTERTAAFDRLLQQVQDGKAQHDHIATIGKYRYFVYIDRSTSPITVVIKHTEEALKDLFDVKNVDKFDETLERQDRLVEEYRHSLIPGSAVPASKKQSRSKAKEVSVGLRPTGLSEFLCVRLVEPSPVW